MAKPKTALEIEIETAAAFYRAVGELENAAGRWGSDFQRAAFDAARELQHTLDVEIRAWNEETGEDDAPLNPALALCAGAESWEPWAKRDQCGIYVVVHGGPMCQSCTARKARWDADRARGGGRA